MFGILSHMSCFVCPALPCPLFLPIQCLVFFLSSVLVLFLEHDLPNQDVAFQFSIKRAVIPGSQAQLCRVSNETVFRVSGVRLAEELVFDPGW